MATGLYWCLVLTECLSLAVISTASFTQTTPPDSIPVCPGGRLVFTCTANDGITIVVWRGHSSNDLISLSSGGNPRILDSFTLTVTPSGSPVVSYATIESVSVGLNGTTISCSSDGTSTFNTLTVNIAGNY